MGGLAGLGSALAGLASRAEQFTTQMTSSMKICPSCGEPSPGDKAFCPHCGAKLPEQTLGQGYVCAKCGVQNTPGTKFCSSCGALLPAAEAQMKAQKEKDDKTLARLHELLPQFPVWSVGGSDFNLEENGTSMGYPVYLLTAECNRGQLDAYIALLLQAGFKQSGDEYWKTVDGVCRVFSATEAFSSDLMNVNFYVDNYDKREEKKAAESSSDLKGLAKGLFKSILG